MTNTTAAQPLDLDKLLPCPFCGGTETYVERLDYSAAYVQCDSRIDEHCTCLARGPVGVQDDDGEEIPGAAAAIRAWNNQAALIAQARTARLAAKAPAAQAVDVSKLQRYGMDVEWEYHSIYPRAWGEFVKLAEVQALLAASPASTPEAAQDDAFHIHGLGYADQEDDGVVILRFKDEAASQAFMENYHPTVECTEMPKRAEVAHAQQPAAPAKRQYYCRMTTCRARNADAPDCICWHDEGTGPRAKEPDSISKWRAAPTAGTATTSENARDAARYRWLRARHVDAGMVEVRDVRCFPESTKAYMRIGGFGKSLDDQVDLQIEAQQEGGK